MASETDSTPDFELVQAAEADFPTEYGHFRILGFEGRTRRNGAVEVEEAVVLRMGAIPGDAPPLLRIHSQCLTGDVFASKRCDCGDQLQMSLEILSDKGKVRVSVSLFGRPTSVELDYLQLRGY